MSRRSAGATDDRPTRVLHVMLRVGNLTRSIAFYTDLLGMELLRLEEYPEGRFTLAFVGYGDERSDAVLELTQNWGTHTYQLGEAFGHVALGVADAASTCDRLRAAGVKILREPGPMAFRAPGREPDRIAFIEDPDGYRIELIERSSG